ncbi:MAG: glycosyltransferase family 1 protein, partial [Patescibacteria group bacterium]|nr:glycosyltransferase family 1 protein [Patescibacteria group bacterium]
KKYGIIKPYLIYVGNAYPHKNLERLVVAYKKIKKENPDLSLVLVGGQDFFYDRLKKFTKEKSVKGVVFPGYIPDEELDVLYRHAKLYVFPSLYEGFGLPPLEALAKSTPVVSSSRTSMPEVLGDIVTYFDPEDLDSIRGAIRKGLKEGKKKLDKEKVALQLSKFSWEEMANQTKVIYEKILK